VAQQGDGNGGSGMGRARVIARLLLKTKSVERVADEAMTLRAGVGLPHSSCERHWTYSRAPSFLTAATNSYATLARVTGNLPDRPAKTLGDSIGR